MTTPDANATTELTGMTGPDAPPGATGPPLVIAYPAELPITERHDELLATIRDHQVVIIAGETGSGKSTQLPKMCLELGRGGDGLIGHTQPRRVAARTIAERIAGELGVELGGLVGYAVRFTDQVGADTRVKVMTDGILLAEIQRDRMLRRYDTLIIDEAHERSLNIDFLLGYLRQLLPRRPDLKLIITSATIDTGRFAGHFAGPDGTPAPIVTVEGRAHPVEMRYRPFGDDPDDDRDQTTAICDAVEELWREGGGDVLVFLSGEREIHDTADALRRLDLGDTEVLPLYARLATTEQRRIFEPHPGRRVVLATNVAETSITVPGVRSVIDGGTARISRYSRRLKVQRLPIEAVSQASADQRAGRCGRVGPGICIRLYSEADYVGRDEFTEPEILRTNLASVILQMAALGLGDIAGFPFVEPPDTRSIDDGIALLEELGALRPAEPGDSVDTAARLTKLGRRLARLPVDPRLGRMVLEAERLGVVREVMVIVAALSIQDPRERPADKREAAGEMHRRFAAEGSDFLAFLRLWDYLREQQRTLSSNQFRRLCRAEYLNYLRVREWQDLFSQLRRVAGDLGLRVSTEAGHPDHVHRALLSGLLSQIGMRDGETREFRGARNARFMIGSGSVLTSKPPQWVMAGELVETNRLWARVVSRIQPEWAEQLAGHLVKRSWSDPWWDAQRGTAMAHEKAVLFGLPIVANRPVDYSRIDAAVARQLFVHHALVLGEWNTHLTVFEENRALVAELEALQDRLRRHLDVDHDALFKFYDARLGGDVVSGRHFDRWWKVTRAKQPKLLTLTREDLLGTKAAGLEMFPDEWIQGDHAFPLAYELAPGSVTDGVTVHVNIDVLNQVDPAGFDWQVPGLRDELIGELVRSLPKDLRRLVTPVNEFTRSAVERLGAGRPVPEGVGLREALADVLTELCGSRIRAGDFIVDRVPRHLRTIYAVDDGDGVRLAAGEDLAELQVRLRGRTRAAIVRAFPGFERTGLTDWDVGVLPRVVEATVDERTVRGYPALVDDGATVSMRILTSPLGQARAMPAAVRRLIALTVASPRKAAESRLTATGRLAIARLDRFGIDQLIDDCVAAAIDHVIAGCGAEVWDDEGFRSVQRLARSQLAGLASAAAAEADETMRASVAAARRIDRLVTSDLRPSVLDARAHLLRLIRPGFVVAAGCDRLADVHRYVRALDRRLERLPDEAHRDRQRTVAVQRLERQLEAIRATRSPDLPGHDLAEVAWQIEELRVSLFAQSIGTRMSVSEQKILRRLAELAG